MEGLGGGSSKQPQKSKEDKVLSSGEGRKGTHLKDCESTGLRCFGWGGGGVSEMRPEFGDSHFFPGSPLCRHLHRHPIAVIGSHGMELYGDSMKH